MRYDKVREKCTQGEWELRSDIPYSPQGWVIFSGRNKDNKTVLRMPFGCSIPPRESEGSKRHDVNAALIVHEHNLFPKLLEALRDYVPELRLGGGALGCKIDLLLEQAENVEGI